MSDQETQNDDSETIMIMTSEIASAYFSNNQVQEDRIEGVIHSIARALGGLPGGSSAAAGAPRAVQHAAPPRAELAGGKGCADRLPGVWR